MQRRSLKDLSGPWSGWWIQESVRGNMRLRLSFANSNINGGGNDPIGQFEISGIWSDDSQRVLFTQQYRTHSVEYVGQWDGTLIYGKWTLHDQFFSESGEFEIWPDQEEQGVQSLAEAFGQAATARN